MKLGLALFASPAALLFTVLAPSAAPAQPVPDPVAQQIPQHPAQQATAAEIDFTSDDTRMTVPVTIGAAGPYRFIVDTGSERTVISHELAGTLGLAPGRTVRITAMSGTASVATVLIPDIIVGSPTTTTGTSTGTAGTRLRGSRIEAPALFERNLGAVGLVGLDALQGHAVTIDFAREVMTVTRSTKRLRTETFGPDDIVIHAKNLLGQLVVTDATYRGHKVRVVIDTGSVVSMGNFALRKLVAPTALALAPLNLLTVTGVTLYAEASQVDGLRVGDVGFKDLPIAFVDAAPFVRLGLAQRPALLLGMDALRLFGRVRIDFANRELRLARPDFADPH